MASDATGRRPYWPVVRSTGGILDELLSASPPGTSRPDQPPTDHQREGSPIVTTQPGVTATKPRGLSQPPLLAAPSDQARQRCASAGTVDPAIDAAVRLRTIKLPSSPLFSGSAPRSIGEENGRPSSVWKHSYTPQRPVRSRDTPLRTESALATPVGASPPPPHTAMLSNAQLSRPIAL